MGPFPIIFWAAALPAAEPATPPAVIGVPLEWEESPGSDPLIACRYDQVSPLKERPAVLKVPPKDLPSGVQYFLVPVGERTVLTVLDPAWPGKLYVDAAGTGDLSNVSPAIARPLGRYDAGHRMFSPVSVSLGGGTDRIVRVRFVWYKGGDIEAEAAGSKTGEVRLDGKVWRVASVDNNLDGRYDRALDLSLFGKGRRSTFDTFAVLAPGGDRFDLAIRMMAAHGELLPLARMVRVGDSYYNAEIAPDGSKVRLEKVDPPMGALDVGSSDVTLSVFGDAGLQTFTGSGGRWKLPAGKYVTALCAVERTDASGVTWNLQTWYRSQMGSLGSIEVLPGRTFEMKVGPPLEPVVIWHRAAQPGQFYISLYLQGSAGERYRCIRKDHGYLLPAFKVLDETGKVVGAGKFPSPPEGPYCVRWRPDGFKGKCRVEIETEAGPFEIRKAPEVWFSVE
jgi:hypothetical protein